MGRDSQITLMLFLTYIVVGLMFLFSSKVGKFVPLMPLIVVFIPALCLLFYYWTSKTIGSLFFLFFPLFAVAIVLEHYVKFPINGLHYATLGAVPAYFWSAWKEPSSKLKWANLILWINGIFLLLSILAYLFFQHYFKYGLIPMFLVSIILLLTMRFSSLLIPSDLMKRILLVLAFSTAIVLTSLLAIAH